MSQKLEEAVRLEEVEEVLRVELVDDFDSRGLGPSVVAAGYNPVFSSSFAVPIRPTVLGRYQEEVPVEVVAPCRVLHSLREGVEEGGVETSYDFAVVMLPLGAEVRGCTVLSNPCLHLIRAFALANNCLHALVALYLSVDLGDKCLAAHLLGPLY